MTDHRLMFVIGLFSMIYGFWNDDAISSLSGTVWICSAAIVKAINSHKSEESDD